MAEPTLLLVHALAPPTRGGTAVVVYRLLRALEGYRVEVVTDRSLRSRVESGGDLVLPARYHYFLKLGPSAAGRFMRELWALLNLPLAFVAGVRAALVARRSGARWIVSPLDGGFSQIAASVGARLSGLPRVVLVFDLWEENAYGSVARKLAAAGERPNPARGAPSRRVES